MQVAITSQPACLSFQTLATLFCLPLSSFGITSFCEMNAKLSVQLSLPIWQRCTQPMKELLTNPVWLLKEPSAIRASVLMSRLYPCSLPKPLPDSSQARIVLASIKVTLSNMHTALTITIASVGQRARARQIGEAITAFIFIRSPIWHWKNSILLLPEPFHMSASNSTTVPTPSCTPAIEFYGVIEYGHNKKGASFLVKITSCSKFQVN